MALTAPQRLRGRGPQPASAPVRRAAERWRPTLGFDEQLRGEAAIVATELADQPRPPRRRRRDRAARRARSITDVLDVIAWDRGPGHRRRARRARATAYSTVGGAGQRARRHRAACRRRSTCRARRAAARRPSRASVAATTPPDRRPRARDDGGGGVRRRLGRSCTTAPGPTILLADGLGHGAERGAGRRPRPFASCAPGLSPEALLERMHDALRATRGAAAAIARLDRATGALRFAGIGNIAATIVDGATTRALVSMNGTLGHSVPPLPGLRLRARRPTRCSSCTPTACSGGWDLALHPGLVAPRPARDRLGARARLRARPRRRQRRRRAGLRSAGVSDELYARVELASRRGGRRARASGPATSPSSSASTARTRPASRPPCSELARNAFRYAGGGRVLLARTADALRDRGERRRARDRRTSTRCSRGRYRSATGMGQGLLGVRRLMDELRDPALGRARHARRRVASGSRRARRAPTRARVRDELARRASASPYDEVTRQNEELLQALGEVRARQEELLAPQPRARGAPTAASSPSTPSSTTAPSACATPTSASRASWPT